MATKKLHVYEIHRINGDVERHEVMGQATLEQLQKWVGGLIEYAYAEQLNKRVIVNEEGLIEGLPVNPHFPQFVGPVISCVSGGRF